MRQISLNFILIFLMIGFTSTAQNYKFGKVSEEEVLQKEHPEDKEANAAVLYRKQNVYYDINKSTGFTLVQEIHERIKIYNKEGFNWATKEISRYIGKSDKEEISQLKGYTYNIVDGKLEDEKLRNDEIFEEERSKYREVTKFTMPGVKEGSVIEYSYKIISPYLGAVGKTPLQFAIPTDRLELEIRIPEYFMFSKYQNLKSPLNFNLTESKKSFSYSFTTTNRNMRGNVVRTSTDRNKIDYMMNMYSINKENIPALKQESHVDNLHNYAAFIDWELQYTKFPNSTIENFSQTWEGVAKSIYTDLDLGREINRTGFYDDDVDEVIAGLSDPRMKTEKIFEFVKHKIKWNDYVGFTSENGIKNAYQEGVGNTGDINLMLISMLRYAKVEAYPVLISTPSNGIPIFPTRDGFNYIVAGVKFDEELILLDATDLKAGIGELPKRARNWQGRLIKEDGASDWVNLMPNSLSENSVKMNLQFDGEKLLGMNIHSYDKFFAKKFREDYASTSTKPNNDLINRIKNVEDVEVQNYKIENKATPGAEITETFNFEVNSGAERIGDKVYLQPLLFEALTENPFKSEERIYPVFFDFPEIKKYSINIMIPEDYKIVSLPESVQVNLGEKDGEFRFVVNGQGRVIRLISHISLNKIAFQPGEYESLKKFYANIIKKHGEAIVLEKTIDNENSERAESGR